MQNGGWVTKPQHVEMAFYNFYKDKFKSSDTMMNIPSVIPHASLNNEDNIKLEKIMTVDEIKIVVWNCGIQKAPSPDGFSFLFLKNYWVLLKDDVVEAVRHTYDTFSIPKGANSSFITLIPKKEETKAYDIKVDFEKAFETVSWKYLDHMLSSLGFGCKWRSLHQGDPLSHFLFIIVMEGLHFALKDAVSSGLLRGTKVFYLASGLKINISKSHVYGLGVSMIDSKNMARDTAIHGDEAGFDLKGCNSSGIWYSIISSYSTLHAHDIIPAFSLCRKVGDGMSIRFLKDNWDGNGPLCSRYNILYHLDSNANCLLADPFSNDTWIWNWNRQSIGSRNVAALDAMIPEIGHISFNNGLDTWSWKISDDDTFSVQATRSHIDNCLLPSLHPSSRWSKFLP
ncbi:hypothetical protein Tco_1135625 [Tanacetum coccineum]